VSCGGTFCRPRMNFTSAHITMHPGLPLNPPGSSPEQAAMPSRASHMDRATTRAYTSVREHGEHRSRSSWLTQQVVQGGQRKSPTRAGLFRVTSESPAMDRRFFRQRLTCCRCSAVAP
jgi:hypothetical protein